MSKNNKKYKATDKGYKEVDDKDDSTDSKTTTTTVSKSKVPVDQDMSIPYPELGHTVSQLAGMEEPKRKSILGARDAEFSKKYL